MKSTPAGAVSLQALPVVSLMTPPGILRAAAHKLRRTETSWIFFWTYALAYAIRHVMVERYVKLFKNGRNQAVRIPREFELPGEDAIIRKEGERLIIEPVLPKSLIAILATLPTLDEDFPPIEDSPAEPVDL